MTCGPSPLGSKSICERFNQWWVMRTVQPKDIDETFFQLNNLALLSAAFHNNLALSIYKDIAARLRFLFVRSCGDQRFITTTLPSLRLSPLSTPCELGLSPNLLFWHADMSIGENPQIRVRAGCKFGSSFRITPGPTVAHMHLHRLFDMSKPQLELQQWLAQPFIRPEWTLEDFMRWVSNKDGGTHRSRFAVIERLEKLGNIHWHLTATIAREIGPQLMKQFHHHYPNHAIALE
jgi:hypothetical protein